MATTLQTQQPQSPSSQPTTPNPQLKRLVYSKYREMLGSYNNKANTIIQSLPNYMVKEDKGFHFDCINDLTTNINGNNNDFVDCSNNDSKRYGAPPAPPSMSGSIPSQRLPTQCAPPACVQNAMMTKDKKPFTYTPSGIDLSQIKSDRMAKRLARNAQMEGVGTNPKPNPYAQQALQQQQQHSPGLAQSSHGMPVQVFPTGPPPPPPQPKQGAAPPPPPPPQQPSKNHLAPQTNGAAARKSPSPQNFEPPPFGCRPEIKIPPNPMAALKKVPKPVEKNDFWIEEYRKDRSKSPMIETTGQSYNQSQDNYNSMQNQQKSQSPPPAVVQQYQQQAPSPMRSPAVSQYQQPPQSQHQQSPLRSPAVNQTQLYDQNRGQSPLKSPAINQTQLYDQNRGQSQIKSPAVNQTQLYDQNRGQSPIKSPAIAQIQSQYQQQARQQQSPIRTFPGGQIQQNRVESPFQSPQDNPNLQRPLSPVRVNQQQQAPIYTRSPGLTSSPPEQQQQTPRNAVGSLYIPPVAPENLANRQQQAQVLSIQQQQLQQQQLQQQQLYEQQLQQQQQLQKQQQLQQQQLQQEQKERKGPPPNRWISAQPTKDVPDWARQNDTTKQQPSPVVSSSRPQQQQQQQQVTSQSPPIRNNVQGQQQQQQLPKLNHMQQNNPGLRLQMTNNVQSTGSNPREHIIPIQLEQTPTPTRSPATPNFGPQPYQNSNQQFSSVSSPSGGNSPGYVIRNPNHFVDQGYNNYGGTQQQQQQPIQSGGTGGTRVVPVRIEGQDSPFNSNNVRGPLSQSPMIMQNDPRTLQHQNSWGNNGNGPTGPNQSKSFRILQKITDTEGNNDDDNNLSLQNGTSSLSSSNTTTNNKQINDNNYDQTAQLQRPQYSRQMSSSSGIGNGVNNGNHHHPQQQQYIDNQTEQIRRMQISNNDQEYMNRVRNHGTPPVMRQQQPPRYVQQTPYQFNEDQYQQYVHPSEQQVPEPKIYTGSAIPSRSFKLLQAMTTPENAAEMEGSGVVDYEQISNLPYPPYPSYPYPYGYPYPPPYPYPQIDSNNWPYPNPSPYPPVPPYYYYYYHHPEYDSQNFYNDPSYSNKLVFPRRHRSLSQERFRDYRRDSRRDSAPPNIIVTPSFDETEENRFHENEKRIAQQNQIREGTNLDNLSEKLNEIIKPDYIELNISKNEDKMYVGEKQKRVADTPSPNYSCSTNSISPVTNERSIIENNEIHNTTNDTDSSSSEDEDEEFDEIKPLEHFWGTSDTRDNQNVKNEIVPDDDHQECKKNYMKAMDFFRNKTNSIDIVLSANDTIISQTDDQITTKKSEFVKKDSLEVDDSEESNSESEEVDKVDNKPDLKLIAIKSVNNIQMYCENDEETTIEDGSKVFDADDTEIEEELTDDDETEIIEESPDEEETDDEDVEEIIIQNNLSIIYEESEGGKSHGSDKDKRMIRQNSESLSEASTTIGNDKEESDNEITDKTKEDDNSVTVRLPLRLSFSKSSNDENITTVEVGKSEIEDQTKSFSIASINNDDYDDYSDDPNVSVTLSLSSSTSGSFDKPECFRQSFSIEKIKEENKSDSEGDDDEDDDVSVSFSLSMRNKFLRETFDGNLTNDIAIETEGIEENIMNKKNKKDDEKENDDEKEEDDEEEEDEEEKEQDYENIQNKNEMKDDEISLLLSPSYKNIWQSFGTTLKDIATKEDTVDTSLISKDCNTVNNLSNSGDDVEDFWATIKESRKREPTPDFWATLKENKDEIIVEPIDEDNEIVESILDSDDDTTETNKQGKIDTELDFWSSIENSKKAIKEIKNDIDDFWGSNQDTEEKLKRNRRAVSELWDTTIQENIKTDVQLGTQINNEEIVNENLDDFWGSQNKADNDSEEKLKNYRTAMEFFRNKRESSLPIKRNEDGFRTEESKDQFQNVWKSFGNAANEHKFENSTQPENWKETEYSDNNKKEEEVEEEEEEEEEEYEEEETDEETVEDEEKYYEERQYIPEETFSNNVTNRVILKEALEREAIEYYDDQEEEYEKDDEEEDEEEEEEEEEDDDDDDEEEEEQEQEAEFTSATVDDNEQMRQQHFISNPMYTSIPSNNYYSPPLFKHEDSPFIFNNAKEDFVDSIDKSEIDSRSVRDKIMAFETKGIDNSDEKLKLPFTSQNTTDNIKDNISRTNSLQRSESELEEDDSGVTDMSKHISETDTESECFPELKKMTRYQRAATHSRLFKLLQEESDSNTSGNVESEKPDDDEEKRLAEEYNLRPSRKKIIHNVSITRRNNPDGLKDAESMSQRRERLSLPLKTSSSIDSDNLSTSNSPTNSNSNSRQNVSDQLVNELVQSLLLKKNTNHLRNIPMEKLKAAAKRVLEEDLDSLENTSLESTPAITPQEFKTDSYTEYYDTWDSNCPPTSTSLLNEDFEIVPSKSLKVLQEQSISGKRKPWSVRCPRVLSSKTINRDLTRVSESPENFRAPSMIRNSTERDNDNYYNRASSITRRKL